MYEDNRNPKITQIVEQILNSSEKQLQIIQHYIPNALVGKSFKTHDENTPSTHLKYHEGKYWIKNFGNGEKSKDCFNIVQEQFNCDFTTAVKRIDKEILKGNATISDPSTKEKSTFDKRIYAIKNNAKEEATAYLSSRNIDTNKLPENSFFQNLDKSGKANGIVFIDKHEKLINTRYFSGKNRYVNSGVLNNSIFDLCFRPELETVYFVEGVINAMSLRKYSSLAIFSTSNLMTDKSILEKYIVSKNIVLAFDRDTAGTNCSSYYQNFILKSGISFKTISRLLLPDGIDINDLLIEKSLSSFLKEKNNYQSLKDTTIIDSINIKHAIINDGFFKENGCYYTGSFKEEKLIKRCISNFLMESLYLIKDDTDDAPRIFKLQRSGGTTDFATITAKNLSLKDFKSAIRSRGNYSFLGSPMDHELILKSICEHEKQAYPITAYGYNCNNNVFIFSNGALTLGGQFIKVNKYGIVKTHNKNLFIPASSCLKSNQQQNGNDKNHVFQQGDLNLHMFSQLFFQAFGNKGIIGLTYLIASFYRDLIFKTTNFFPFLFLFGDYGTGKTSFTEILLRPFGESLKGISLEGGSTSKSIARTVSQITNGLIYLKELDPKSEKRIEGFLKTGYDGVGYSRAQTTNDNQTHETKVNSGIILDGNYIPTASSTLYNRMILTNFEHQEYTAQERDAFNELMKFSEKGMGQLLVELIKLRDHFMQHFEPNYFAAIEKIIAIENHSYAERTIKHMSLLYTVYEIIHSKLKLPVGMEVFQDHLIGSFRAQQEILENISEANQFWHIIDLLFFESKLKESTDFRLTSKNGKDILLIHFSRIYHKYRQHCQVDKKEYLDQHTLLMLLKSKKYFHPGWQKGRADTVTDKMLGSCYAFESNQLPINISLWQK